MLAFPHMYYQYVGKYKKDSKKRENNRFESMSQFLQSQLVHAEYRQLLE